LGRVAGARLEALDEFDFLGKYFFNEKLSELFGKTKSLLKTNETCILYLFLWEQQQRSVFSSASSIGKI
jgi:hypothetical protein